MGAKTHASSALRRLAIFVACFFLTFFTLRQLAGSYSDHFSNSAPPIDPVTALRNNQPPLHGNHDNSDNSSEFVTPRARLTERYQQYLEWEPPLEIKNHYPGYGDYFKRDYDPNRWEDFEQNNRLFRNGTFNARTSKAPAKPYKPYPAYNSAEWKRHWRGTYVPCSGPDGISYETHPEALVSAYEGIPEDFPPGDTGSYEAVGLDESVCFDRLNRLVPYGYRRNGTAMQFYGVKWQKLQNECVERNKDRFRDSSPPSMGRPDIEEQKVLDNRSTKKQFEKKDAIPSPEDDSTSSSQSYQPRTAVLIRTWDKYEYQENDIMAIRSLVTELSLLSGGEYQVFLFVNIKDPSLPIYNDQRVYDELMAKFVPEELQDIAILWTEALCYSWYPLVGEWGVNFQQFMPVQWFRKLHPQFDYIWNWEMDARLIGHHYHFLEQVRKFSRAQPRKYLWERNGRYYFPNVHGSYEDFINDTNKIVEEQDYIKTVWGPQPWNEDQEIKGPSPPHSEEEDNFSWGVDEEADFISLLPIWDPRETFWSYRDKLWGYKPSENSNSRRPYPDVPRRTFINTVIRLSARLLDVMHDENRAGFSMVSEMWPSSIALQHGFKAVYAPHPIWFAHQWPLEYMENVFNADGWGAGAGIGTPDNGRGLAYDPELAAQGLKQQGTGPNGEGKLGRWGQERDSPYSPDREHNFAGWSWYFWSDFPKVIYWRWLGWKTTFNFVTIEGTQTNDEMAAIDWGTWENENGRMCVPSMLLHPIKHVLAPDGYHYED